MKLSPFFTALACFAVTQSPLAAQQTQSGVRSDHHDRFAVSDDPDPLNGNDAEFLKATAQGLRFEVAAGRLALTRAADSGVKQFAQLMIRDHAADYTGLVALAKEEGVSLPPGVSSEQSAEYEKLEKLSGASFDQEYIAFEIQDHHMDIHDYTEEVRTGEDFDVQRYASNGVTELLEHLYVAKSVGQAIGVSNP
jgi:putative membrane protein